MPLLDAVSGGGVFPAVSSVRARAILLVSAPLWAFGCAAEMQSYPEPDRISDVRFQPGDMQTNITAEALAEGADWARIGAQITVNRQNFAANELANWDGAIRLVRWPSTELVPGEWHYDEATTAFWFVRDGAYPEGWYALQVDFARTGGRRAAQDVSLPVFDGWTTTRFRVGSQPLISLGYSLGNPGSEWNTLDFSSSELVQIGSTRRFTEFLAVTVDGEPRRCHFTPDTDDTFGPSPWSAAPRPFFTASPQCGFVPTGALVDVVLRDGFAPVPLMDYGGESPPHWTFRVGEATEVAPPADAVFVATTERP